MARCIDEIIRASGGKISEAQAVQIIKAVEKKFSRLSRSPRDESHDGGKTTRSEPPLEQDTRRPQTDPNNRDSTGHDAAMSDSERMTRAATEAHADALTAAEKNLRIQKLQIEQTARAMAKTEQYGHGNDGVLELLKRDVEGQGNAIANNLITTVWEPLRLFIQERGEWSFMGKRPTREAVLELVTLLRDPELSKKLAGNENKWSNTERLAYKIRLALDIERTRKNSLGADIGKIEGYSPQGWDALSIKWFGLNIMDKARINPGRAGYRTLMNKARETWTDYVLPLVDRARYLDGKTGQPLDDEGMKDVLRNIWLTIADHGANKEQIGSDGKMVESMAAHRELHFKDAASWYEANSKFGTHDVVDGIFSKLTQAGRQIALMETFGPWAERGYKTIQAWAAGKESAAIGRGSEGKKLVDDYFNELAGRNGGVDEMKYAMIARTMTNVRTGLSAALLGSLPFSQIPDMATLFAMAKYNTGSNKEMFEVLKILDPRAKSDRELAQLHGFLADSVINDVVRRMNMDSASKANGVNVVADLVMAVSGAKLWTDGLKLAGQLHTGYFLAKYRKLTFDKLDPFFTATLQRYHIDAADWEMIRSADVATIRGMEIITPANLFKVQHPKEMDVPAADAPALRRITAEAATKAVDMILAEADIMVLTPDSFTRSKMHGSAQAGTFTGELSRSFWMFKSFTLAMMDKVLPRLTQVAPGNTLAFRAELVLGLLGAGAFSVQCQNISQGKNPQNMNPYNDEKDSATKFWLRAFTKSGGGGIIGDLLVQDYSNIMEGIGRMAVGPTGALATDLLQYTIGNAIVTSEDKDPKLGMDTVRLLRRYTPFANLWYARAAFDHLLFNKAQEAMNPGYLRRMENRMQRQNNITHWWAPSDSLPESPPNLGAAVGME